MYDLTILIPTYNRKERLMQTLKCLSVQTDRRFQLVIVDNCSNYNVNELITCLDEEFRSRINLMVRPYNIGSSANITMILLECKSKWAWLLGDDDYPLPCAVEKIYENMAPQIGAMHFSVLNMKRYISPDCRVSDLDTFINLYEHWLHDKNPIVNLQGDLIFMSNKVYNMEIIRPYIGMSIEYSYSKIGQLIPIFRMLEEKTGEFLITDTKIVKSLMAENDHWNIQKILYGMTSFTYIPFVTLKNKQRILLNDVVMFKYTYVLKNYILDGKNNWQYIDTLYHTIYKRILPLFSKILFRMVSLCMEIGPIRRLMKKIVLKIEERRNAKND